MGVNPLGACDDMDANSGALMVAAPSGEVRHHGELV